MVKHTQTIRRQKPTNCLSVFGHFVGLALNRLNKHLPCNCKLIRLLDTDFERNNSQMPYSGLFWTLSLQN